MCQAQVEADFVEMAVGLAQIAQANFSSAAMGIKQCFLKVERGAHQAVGYRAAVNFWEAFCLGQYPL